MLFDKNMFLPFLCLKFADFYLAPVNLGFSAEFHHSVDSFFVFRGPIRIDQNSEQPARRAVSQSESS